jgi:hypothetical protein
VSLRKVITKVSQKIKGLKKKNIYCKYTEMQLILFFNVILLDINAPVPAFKFFFNSIRIKLLVASLTDFAPPQ